MEADIQVAFSALQMEAASYSIEVRIWMRVMAISYFAGIVFTPWKTGARWVVVTMILTFAGLLLGKLAMPDVTRSSMGTLIHLLLWPTLLFMLWRPGARPAFGTWWIDRVYFGWLSWVSLLIGISLVLDAGNLLVTAVGTGWWN